MIKLFWGDYSHVQTSYSTTEPKMCILFEDHPGVWIDFRVPPSLVGCGSIGYHPLKFDHFPLNSDHYNIITAYVKVEKDNPWAL